jgi:hypothetical protein
LRSPQKNDADVRDKRGHDVSDQAVVKPGNDVGSGMKERTMGKRFGLGAITLACICFFSLTRPGHAQTVVRSLAVIELDYVDTSGEVRDQRADHAQHLKVFAESLRSDLGRSGKFRLVILDCAPAACTASTTPPAELVVAAERAGAAYILMGGIQKKSTLIQWGTFAILDVGKQKIIFDRSLSFRGDDDIAWRRAEGFLARDILEQDVFK